jgi:hypothetical protein
MKAASVQELKEELKQLPPKDLLELCIRLARFKKENKELLSFLLFEAHDEPGFVEGIKNEMDELFLELPKANWFLTKKSLRKIIRLINKYKRYMQKKESEIELRIHFCTLLKNSLLSFGNSQPLRHLFDQELIRAEAALRDLHEELQYDYRRKLEALR